MRCRTHPKQPGTPHPVLFRPAGASRLGPGIKSSLDHSLRCVSIDTHPSRREKAYELVIALL